MRYFFFSLTFFLAILLSSCTDDRPTDAPDSAEKVVTLSIQTDSAIVQVGDRIKLSTLESTDGIPISEYRWTFSDGQSLTGKEVSVSFAASGVVEVKLEAFSGGRSVGSDQAQLGIVAPGTLAPAAYGLPQTLGDVDGNNRLELEDALLVTQATEGLISLDAQLLDNADLDRDGSVNAVDVALMQKAVLRDEPLPRALLSLNGRSGSIVGLVSPDLLPTATKVEVRVNGQASPQVLRAVRGYASFVIPKGVVKGAAPASVELLVNGAVKDRFDLQILDQVVRPGDARADVLQFLSELEAVLVAQQDALRTQIATLTLSDADSVALLAAGEAGLVDLRAARQEFITLMAGDKGDLIASQFQQALYANGLQEFRSNSVGALASKTTNAVPDRLCDVVLPALCGLKRVASALGTGSSVMSGTCSVIATIAVIGAISPFDGPVIEGTALGAFLGICVRVYAGLEVASTISSLVSPIEPGLRLSADKTTLGQNESATVEARITFQGVHELCGLGATGAGEALINKKLGERIVGRMMRNNAAVSQLARVFASFGEGYYARFLKYLQNGVSNTLSGLQVTNAVSDFVSGFCPAIETGSARAVAANIIQTPNLDEGNLIFQPDGTAKYYCPPAGPVFRSSINLIGTKTLCGGKVATSRLAMTCATSPVTITMGDNGSALDDIYEVVVGGRTVLTSSTPTRSISVTLHLPKGRHEVIMRGLAAPDGIGTYFISFSGAGYVGGDPLSGSDLVPGTSKRFTIEVL